MPSPCRSCRAPIRWAHTGEAAMPIDVDPTPVGNITLTPRMQNTPHAEVLTADEADQARADGATLYRSHFASCPGADVHRKRGRR